MNSQTRERFGLAALLGIPIGIMSAFVKWGGEFRLPSRSPMDMFDAACGPESAIRATDAIYEFAGHAFNYVMFTHIIFSIVFAVGYCIVAEKFPKITMWQGVLAGILANIAVYVISLPILGLTPPLWTLPWYEHVSEFVGHVLWFWSIELMRRDLQNRITKEKDLSDCCCNA